MSDAARLATARSLAATLGSLLGLATVAAGCSSPPVSLPKLGPLASHEVLVVTNRRGSGAYEKIKIAPGRAVQIAFACIGGGGAEVDAATRPNDFTFFEVDCSGAKVAFPGVPALSTTLDFRVRSAPDERWSAVISQ